MVRKSLISLVFGLGFGVLVAAQGSSQIAQCSTGFDWSFNSLNQSPCVMASYLGGACTDGVFGIPALPTTENVYNGLPLGQNNPCRCSSVFYSVLSACADCQGRGWRNWTQFTENCTETFVSSFPRGIPSGTRIPSWAYLNVATNNTFDADVAQSQLDAPESTGISPSTVSSVSATSTSSPTASATGTESGSSKKKVGPIVGGVIGGVVGLCLIVIFIVWLLRRRKNNTPPSGLVLDDIDPPSQAGLHPGYMQEVPNKLYDPTDPSTFPPSIPPQPVSPPRSPPPGSFMSSPPPANTRDARWSYISAAPTTQISLHPNRFTGNPEL